MTAAGGRTIQEFQKLIEQRIQWCNETKEDAVAAIAITALRSIRASTRVADATKPPDVEITTTPFVLSYERKGGRSLPCIRNNGGLKYDLGGNERLVVVDFANKTHVFKFKDEIIPEKKRTYYIAASSSERAAKFMQDKLLKRIKAYSGLARKALTVLMTKTCTISDNVPANPKITKVANDITQKTDMKNGDEYSLQLSDNLDYAVQAVEGGEGIVDMSLKKAANKAASVINQKCRGILNFEKLDTPFPEVSKKRK